jgi:tRNA (mo5U34)-methyltransferase
LVTIQRADSDRARRFLETNQFLWHQRFELAPGVFSPGASNVAFLLERANLPGNLTGKTVLDIGTTNGGCAFEAERRGAARVVAVDIASPTHFGFAALREFLESRVEFLQATIYELPEILKESFDIVFFLGVFYHLRHPLLALDQLRSLSRGEVFIEGEISDHLLDQKAAEPYVRFYRGAELSADPSNWFVPTLAALKDWIASSGFDVRAASSWPSEAPRRALVHATRGQGDPEFARISYERPFTSVSVAGRGHIG